MRRLVALSSTMSDRQVAEQPRRLGGDRAPRDAPVSPQHTVKAKVLPRPGSLSTVIVPAHQSRQRAAIVSPRPVPPYFRVVDSVLLLEGPEDLLLLVGRDADAGVAHGELQSAAPTCELEATAGLRRSDRSTRTTTSPSLRELDGVADQVEQHLPEPAASPNSTSGTSGSTSADQLQPLPVGTHGQGPQRVAQGRPHREVGQVQLQLAGLDLGEIEQVVDDAEQVVRRRLDRLQALPLVIRSGAYRGPTRSCRGWRSSGVRISWLTLARNSSLARFAASADLLGLAQTPPRPV